MLKDIKFNSREWKMLLYTVLISAFILSFDEWGTQSFEFLTGLKNFVLTAVIVLFSLSLKIYVQKYYSKKEGFDVEFRPWVIGFIIGIFLIAITNGKFVFLAFGGLLFTMIESTSLGKQEYMSFNRLGWLSVLGPFTSILIALFGKLLLEVNIFNQQMLLKLISINLWFAFYSMLPIPFVHKFKFRKEKIFGTSDGLKMLYASPLEYFIVIVLSFIAALSIIILPAKASLFANMLCFLLIYAVYYIFYKQNMHRPGHKVFKYRD